MSHHAFRQDPSTAPISQNGWNAMDAKQPQIYHEETNQAAFQANGLHDSAPPYGYTFKANPRHDEHCIKVDEGINKLVDLYLDGIMGQFVLVNADQAEKLAENAATKCFYDILVAQGLSRVQAKGLKQMDRTTFASLFLPQLKTREKWLRCSSNDQKSKTPNARKEAEKQKAYQWRLAYYGWRWSCVSFLSPISPVYADKTTKCGKTEDEMMCGQRHSTAYDPCDKCGHIWCDKCLFPV